MQIPPVLMVFLVGLAPIAVFASLIVVPGTVKWQPPKDWQTNFGTPASDNRATAIAADKSGIYSVGHVGFDYYGTYLPVSPSYAFLDKFDLSGLRVWSQTLGDPRWIDPRAINVGSDGLYVSGVNWANRTIFVEKHDFNGTILWTRNVLPNGIDFGIATSSSDEYIVGTVNGSISVTSLDPNGNVNWNKSLTTSGPGAALVYATQDSVYIAGSYPAPTRLLYDTHAFIARYDTSGALIWNNQFDYPPGVECACVPHGLSGDGSGIYVGGTSSDKSLSGETRFYYGGSFLRKYDSSGNILWTNGQAGSSIDGQLTVSPWGIYSLGGNDLMKFDLANGNQMWSVPITGRFSDSGWVANVAVGENGVYVEGSGVQGFYNLAMIVGYAQSPSLVLGGVNPPFSFMIIGGIVGVSLFGIFLVFRSSRKRHKYRSEGELPETRLSRQRTDDAAQWWINKQIVQRESEVYPGTRQDHQDDDNGSDSQDEQSTT